MANVIVLGAVYVVRSLYVWPPGYFASPAAGALRAMFSKASPEELAAHVAPCSQGFAIPCNMGNPDKATRRYVHSMCTVAVFAPRGCLRVK